MAHRNHAAEGEKKSELGYGRDAGTAMGELAKGFDSLRELAGARFRPVLVPPWNESIRPCSRPCRRRAFAV